MDEIIVKKKLNLKLRYSDISVLFHSVHKSKGWNIIFFMVFPYLILSKIMRKIIMLISALVLSPRLDLIIQVEKSIF